VSAIVPPIDPTLPVNEILRRYPAAVRALNAFGIDTCCGGAMPLEDAARKVGVGPQDLADAIAALVARPAPRR
jgi:regulator of cell morphogenesis and NO signaling